MTLAMFPALLLKSRFDSGLADPWSVFHFVAPCPVCSHRFPPRCRADRVNAAGVSHFSRQSHLCPVLSRGRHIFQVIETGCHTILYGWSRTTIGPENIEELLRSSRTLAGECIFPLCRACLTDMALIVRRGRAVNAQPSLHCLSNWRG